MPQFVAIVPAAGSSTRFGRNKLLEMLDGASILHRSLIALGQHPACRAIQVPRDQGPKWLSGLRASVNVINLFDRDPPVVLTQAGQGYAAYDASNANIYGRYVSFQLTKDF